jgi:hypothetical protein
MTKDNKDYLLWPALPQRWEEARKSCGRRNGLTRAKTIPRTQKPKKTAVKEVLEEIANIKNPVTS